ncbi:probable protein phosphatase 2C 27 [Cryptomeria japonica]|uniref:probable protein phosphatase 2C 27 n=1 Tax=Cryptomeria japonica TaxID=3369 RepID=UPI0027DA325D|nr:probable protein phosphatase 2C 27 [Cryptomeria japonica]
MEDTHVGIDNFTDQIECSSLGDGQWALFVAFDGHGGKHTTQFVCDKLPNLIVKEIQFPVEVEKVVRRALLHIDNSSVEACSLHTCLSSGTTALVATVFGRYLLVAGDCRVVLLRKGKAIEMSRDYNTDCSRERKHIEASGGYIDDGLNIPMEL